MGLGSGNPHPTFTPRRRPTSSDAFKAAAGRESTGPCLPGRITAMIVPRFPATAATPGFVLGQDPVRPERRWPEDWTYATVHKEREDDRVVAVERRLIFETERHLEQALAASSASQTVDTSFVEREHGSDRGQNARKARKTYRFSKDWRVHESRAITRCTVTTSAGWSAPYGNDMGRVGGSGGRSRWPPG